MPGRRGRTSPKIKRNEIFQELKRESFWSRLARLGICSFAVVLNVSGKRLIVLSGNALLSTRSLNPRVYFRVPRVQFFGKAALNSVSMAPFALAIALLRGLIGIGPSPLSERKLSRV